MPSCFSPTGQGKYLSPDFAQTAAHIDTTLCIRYCYGFHCVYVKPLDPAYSKYTQWIYKTFVLCLTTPQLEFTGHIERFARKLIIFTNASRRAARVHICLGSCGYFGLMSY